MSIRASDHFSPLLAPGARSTLSVGELIRRAEHAAWLLCDVDGVLTDGRLYFDDNSVPLVSFDIKDGLGLKLAQAAGLKVGLLSGRRSPAAERRAADLGLDLAWFGRPEKGPAFADMLAEQKVKAEQVIYVGDDLPDLALFGLVGVAAAPADAVAEVQAKAHLVLAHAGGRGAVRELVELLLRARGSWDGVVARFAGR